MDREELGEAVMWLEEILWQYTLRLRAPSASCWEAFKKALADFLSEDGLAIIEETHYNELLEKSSAETLSGKVLIKFNSHGVMFVEESPPGIEVEVHDFRRGKSCDVCGNYVKNSDVGNVSVSESGQPKHEKIMCPTCIAQAVDWLASQTPMESDGDAGPG